MPESAEVRAVTRHSCSPSTFRTIRMSSRPERLCWSFRAAIDRVAWPRSPEPTSRSGRNVAAERTPLTAGMPDSASPTSRTMSSLSAGRIGESSGNRSTTSTGTSGPIDFSSQA